MTTSAKHKDSGKVLHKADTYDLGPASLTVAAGCTVDGVTAEAVLDNLRRAFPHVLSEFPELRLRFKTIDGTTHWAFCNDDELAFPDLVSQVEAPDTAPTTALPLESHPLWCLRVSSPLPLPPTATSTTNSTNSTANVSTHLRLFTSHSFCDGRTVFDLLSLFVHFATRPDATAANAPEPFRSQWARRSALGTLESGALDSLPYGKRGWFAGDATAGMCGTPASWRRVVVCQLTPAVDVPSHSVASQWDFEYAPVAAFCCQHGATVQGIVGAAHAHAMWAFSGAQVKEISVCTPTDTRRYPFSTEAHRSGAFFGRTGFVLVFLPRQKTLLEEIVECTRELHAVLKTTEAAHCVLTQSGAVGEGDMAPFPDCGRHNVVCASHIGRVCTGMNVHGLTFSINNPVAAEGEYWPSLYAFHTDKVLSFSLMHPWNVPQGFVDAVHTAIKEAMDLAGAHAL